MYRGGRTAGGRLPGILLFLLVLLLVAAAVVFYALPQYLIYYKDGVELVVPSLQLEGEPDRRLHVVETTDPVAYSGEAAATLTVAPPDYSAIQYGSGEGLEYLQALHIPFEDVGGGNKLETVLQQAQRREIKGLVLEMKDETGMLAWYSAVDTATAYSTNGTWNLDADIAELKADGWYLVAELSCCVDAALAERMPSGALLDAAGAPYADAWPGWLDPWNGEVRRYVAALAQELMEKGFDEVLLEHVEHPVGSVVYSRPVSPELDRTTCVTNFALSVRRALEETMAETGARLDVRMSHDALVSAAAENGQTLENMLRVFDRIVVNTAAYGEDAAVFVERHIDSTLRFVPGMTWTFSGGSWLVTDETPTNAEEE